MRKVAIPLVLCILIFGSHVQSQEPEQLPAPRLDPKQEQLPLPRQFGAVPIPVPLMIPREDYPRLGRQSVWRLYAIDQMGQVQPRVVYSPSGAYYQHNGAPYPWADTRPDDFSRFISQ